MKKRDEKKLKNNYWVAFADNGFLNGDEQISYGSYELAAKRFATKEEAENALYEVDCEYKRVKFIK